MPDINIDYAAQDTIVREWNQETFRDIKNRYMALINSPKRTGEGFESLAARTHQSYGSIDAISYSFNRYLVFVHKGVGRGRPIGSDKVKPKPWLNPVLDEQVPKLADLVSTVKADQAIKAVQIK